MKKLIFLVVFLFIACGVSEERADSSDRTMGGGKADGVDNASDAQQGEVNEQMMGGETQDGESLADSFDYCGEFELYDDDICHRFCFEPDPDCEGVLEEEEDFCNAYRESDEVLNLRRC